MKRFDMRRIARYGGAVGVLVAVAIAIAMAAATAEATPNKPYTANVHQTLNTAGSFTLTLTNDPHASQTLGSANFTAPAGFVLQQGAVATGGADASGFNVTVVGNVVQFRAKSSQQALGASQSVSADVVVTGGIAGCGSARWAVEAKQSNDFSGQPGNDLTLNPASDLTPLGSFAFASGFDANNNLVPAPIESVKLAPDGITPVHVPQIIVSQPTSITITALDTCGHVDTDYAGATLNKLPNFGLVNATFSSLSWSSGIGSATLNPADVEVSDKFSVNDGTSGIFANSISTGGSPTFDVVQTICAGGGASCQWKDPNGKPITANSTVNGPRNGQASLGLGYKQFRNGVSCSSPGSPVGLPIGDSIQIVPFGYTSNYTVVLNYGKQLVPSGPASGVVICKSFDDGQTWDRTKIPPCGNTPVAPCEQAQKVSGGALQVTLYLTPGDPHSGGFSP